jgi:hypothetical protein
VHPLGVRALGKGLLALRTFAPYIEVFTSQNDGAVRAIAPISEPEFLPADATETIWFWCYRYWEGRTAFRFATMPLR